MRSCCVEEAQIGHESIFGDNEAGFLRDAQIAFIAADLRGHGGSHSGVPRPFF